MANSLERLSLRYGDGRVDLAIPAGRLAGFHRLSGRPAPAAADAALLAAGAAELAASGFARDVAGRRLTLIVDDATRAEPREPVLDALAPLLRTAARVRIVVGTGTHDPGLPENVALAEELRAHAARLALPRAEVHLHDSRDPFAHRSAGATSRGVEVWVDRAADDADLFLAVSDMKTHYFAGYSNAVKNFVPAICGFDTVRANHAMAMRHDATFGRHPFHPDPARRDNALAADMVEGMERLLGGRPAYALAMFTSSNRVRWCGGGALAEVTARGIATVDAETTLELEPAERLVVSAGGYPYDESLYSAQRALELTKNAVKPGGEVLFLAECRNGVGPPEAHTTFFRALARPLPEVLRLLGAKYEMYSHKAYKFAEMLLSLRAVWVVSRLPEEELRAAHLRPAASAQAVVDAWVAESPSARIQVIDEGSKLAVNARAGAAV